LTTTTTQEFHHGIFGNPHKIRPEKKRKWRSTSSDEYINTIDYYNTKEI
jgi:hypothetical protein